MIKLSPEEFLQKSLTAPLIDVRSPGEFASGHIPGAFNLPLFEDEERSVVGFLYKNQGRQEAIRKGLEIVGPKMTALVDQAIELAKDQEILVHCWRGGMRSSSVAWLFEASDLKVYILDGGYKNYRHYIRENILLGKQLLVLGGLTGSGKTNILKDLRKAGELVVDLEGLANHRGSAFGSVGLGSQPSTEHFENLLYKVLCEYPKDKCIWIEDESRRIGELFIPEYFHQSLRSAPVVRVRVSDEERKQVLINEYAKQPDHELIEAIELLRKRVGGLACQRAIEMVKIQDYEGVVDLLLPYYDKLYNYGLKKRESATVQECDLIDVQLDQRVPMLVDLRKKIESDFFG